MLVFGYFSFLGSLAPGDNLILLYSETSLYHLAARNSCKVGVKVIYLCVLLSFLYFQNGNKKNKHHSVNGN